MYGGTTGRHVARHGADSWRTRTSPKRSSKRASKWLQLHADDVTYFLGRETIIVTRREGMAIWREKLFVLMAQCGSRHGFLPATT